MTYKFDLLITTSVSADTVERMVRDTVEAQSNRKIKSIIARTTQPMGSSKSSFGGYSITFEDELVHGTQEDAGPPFVADEYDSITPKVVLDKK
jgi:3-methyladenine DNA glycosylase Tag